MHSHDELIKYLVKNGRLQSPRLMAAFRAVDRKDFVLPEARDWAYEDHALGIGHKATISQPSTVAFMLEKLAAGPGDKVLDVGAGSGWTTALLAQLVGAEGAVYGVEIVPALVELGNHNLSKYHFPQATILQATQTLGLPPKAPFDRILVSAGSSEVPEELMAQLSIGGILVIPIRKAIWQVKKLSETESTVHQYPGFVFVPLQD